MDYAQQQRNPAKHLPSILLVVGLHIALGYALVTGLARRVVDVIKQPLETKIIEEIKKPPPDQPPPPPPKLATPPPPFIPPPEVNIQVPVQAAPTITTVTTTKPPPGPPPKAIPPAPPPQPAIRKNFAPSYKPGEMPYPSRALKDGIEGTVVAWLHVAANGSVTNVEIRSSSNRLFDRDVIRYLSQYKFAPEATGFIAEVELTFKLTN